MGWIVQYLGMVESDMSAIHRIDDIRSMPARRFLGLATRLIYYPNSGLRQLVELERDQKENRGRQPTNEPARVTHTPQSDKKVYTDIKYNVEAFQLGIIEGGTG